MAIERIVCIYIDIWPGIQGLVQCIVTLYIYTFRPFHYNEKSPGQAQCIVSHPHCLSAELC